MTKRPPHRLILSLDIYNLCVAMTQELPDTGLVFIFVGLFTILSIIVLFSPCQT